MLSEGALGPQYRCTDPHSWRKNETMKSLDLRSAVLATVLIAASAGLSTPADAQELTDAEVAHVAVTANAIDIDLAMVALERGSSESVKAFARTMVDDHTGVNAQATALAGRLGVTPQTNGVSESLREDADQVKANLQRLSGGEFDRAYIAREVAYHQAVVGAIDEVLIPTTENAELLALLRTVRPAIVAHLERAKQIQGSMGS